MGYGDAITKWLVVYTCNFLNTVQGDPYVLNMLSNGGRLVLGAGSKSYIDGEEGTYFGMYLAQGKTFKDAYFDAAKKAQESIINLDGRCGVCYSILYYGPDDAGTLNDRITMPIEEVQYTGGKIICKEINKSWGIYYS